MLANYILGKPAKYDRNSFSPLFQILINSITIHLLSEHQSIPADKTHSGFTKRWWHLTVRWWHRTV